MLSSVLSLGLLRLYTVSLFSASAKGDGGEEKNVSLPHPVTLSLSFSSHAICFKVLLRWKKNFSFSLDSDLTFCKNAPCQLLRLNFKNKSDFFNYDFSFKLSAITRLCSSRVASRELDRERK